MVARLCSSVGPSTTSAGRGQPRTASSGSAPPGRAAPGPSARAWHGTRGSESDGIDTRAGLVPGPVGHRPGALLRRLPPGRATPVRWAARSTTPRRADPGASTWPAPAVGGAPADVTAPAGRHARARRRCRPRRSPADPVAVPAGWHRDPWGLAGLRWWDGTQWTGHVSGPAASEARPVDSAGERALARWLRPALLLAAVTSRGGPVVRRSTRSQWVVDHWDQLVKGKEPASQLPAGPAGSSPRSRRPRRSSASRRSCCSCCGSTGPRPTGGRPACRRAAVRCSRRCRSSSRS